jgi:hypothetical protein
MVQIVNTTTTIDPVNMYNKLNEFIMRPMNFIILLLVVMGYYSKKLFNIQKGGDLAISDTTNNKGNLFTILIVVILIILILVNALQYLFSINVTAYIKDLFAKETTVDIVVDQTKYESPTVPQIKFRKQVFNIPGNYYTYDNAKALCSAYNSELASYDQIEKAYDNGAEWCNYGWSADQLALFPTQKKTYNTLQTIPGHENDCGRPGVNGGYIANPNVRYGANCYGYKPKMGNEEEELMKTSSPYPETREDKIFQEKVDFMKNNLDKILVSPFNHNTWSSLF